MMNASDIIPRLLKECPELQQLWDEHVNQMKSAGKPHMDGVDSLILFGMYLDRFYISRQTEFFPRFFGFLERILTESEDTCMAVDKMLEIIWRGPVTRTNGPELYAAWMGPETKQLWEQAGRNLIAKHPRYAKLRPRKQPGPLPEYRVTLKKCEPGEMAIPPDYFETTGPGTATKFGGDPNWIQPDQRPTCPCCNQDMTFIAQIDSIENARPYTGYIREIMRDPQSRAAFNRDRQWIFGDVGMIYVFFCFDCLETNAVFQCH